MAKDPVIQMLQEEALKYLKFKKEQQEHQTKQGGDISGESTEGKQGDR